MKIKSEWIAFVSLVGMVLAAAGCRKTGEPITFDYSFTVTGFTSDEVDRIRRRAVHDVLSKEADVKSWRDVSVFSWTMKVEVVPQEYRVLDDD